MDVGNYCYICMEQYENLKSHKLIDYNYQKNSEKNTHINYQTTLKKVILISFHVKCFN